MFLRRVAVLLRATLAARVLQALLLRTDTTPLDKGRLSIMPTIIVVTVTVTVVGRLPWVMRGLLL